jgi:putative methyltransferase (TIGR04325 family)
LEKIYNSSIEYLIIDRTSFVDNEENILTIQNVYKEIYEAKYPVCFFSRKQLEKYIERKYEIIYTWDGFDQFALKGHKVFSRGYLLRRIN